MKHYLYQHVRSDTNEVFYVGVGTKSSRGYKTFKSNYYRAHTKKGRNKIWGRITAKVSYRVEILYESDDYGDIKSREVEMIARIGKRSHYGTLCNLSDGGDGGLSVEKPKGKHSSCSKKVYQYTLEGNFVREWDSGNDIQRELGHWSNSIYNCCNRKKKNKTAYGFQWSYQKMTVLIPRKKDYHSKPVLQLMKSGELVKVWSSSKSAALELNMARCHINSCCNLSKSRRTAGGFRWIFKL